MVWYPSEIEVCNSKDNLSLPLKVTNKIMRHTSCDLATGLIARSKKVQRPN